MIRAFLPLSATTILLCLHVNYVFPLSSGESTRQVTYVSDMKIIHSGNVYRGVGIDRPFWTNDLIICGIKYKKGIVIHPEDGGVVGFVEFLLPTEGGRLLGVAGWAEQSGISHTGTMSYRIFVDGELLTEGDVRGNGCQDLDLDLRSGRVLRIESDDGSDGYETDHMAFGDLRVEHQR